MRYVHYWKDYPLSDIKEHGNNDKIRYPFSITKGLEEEFAKKNGLKVVNMKYNSTPLQFSGSIFSLLNFFEKKEWSLNNLNISERGFLFNILFIMFLPLSYIFNILKVGDQFEIVLKKINN